jgi:transposase
MAKSRDDAISRWAAALHTGRGYWKAVVALAAKNARRNQEPTINV